MQERCDIFAISLDGPKLQVPRAADSLELFSGQCMSSPTDQLQTEFAAKLVANEMLDLKAICEQKYFNSNLCSML